MENSSNLKIGDIVIYEEKHLPSHPLSFFKLISYHDKTNGVYGGECVAGFYDTSPKSSPYWNISPNKDCFIGYIASPISKLEKIIYGIQDNVKI